MKQRQGIKAKSDVGKTYYALYDTQTNRHMGTGLNSTSKAELKSDLLSYLSVDHSTKELNELRRQSLASLASMYEFDIQEQPTKFEEEFAKGGSVDNKTSELSNIHTNIMGTASFDLKIPGMRKAQDFSVLPIDKESKDKKIMIQSDTRIGMLDLESGRGAMSQSHSSGAYFHHLSFDKKTFFQLTSLDAQNLKMQIFATAGSKVGNGVVFSDNSGAIRVLAAGGRLPSNIDEWLKRSATQEQANSAKKVARWLEANGSRVSGGTAIGKNYDTLILDVKYQGSEIRINENGDIKFEDHIVTSPKEFSRLLSEYKNSSEENRKYFKVGEFTPAPLSNSDLGLENGGQVDGYNLIYSMWNEPTEDKDGQMVAGTIRTYPGNHWVASILVDDTIKFDSWDGIGKNIDPVKVKKLWQRGDIEQKIDKYAKGGRSNKVFGAEDFKNLTIEKMKEQFPYDDKDIIKIANDIVKGRDAEVEKSIIISSNTHLYDTFANLQKILYVKLNDAGQSDVTPGGTYHSKKGITLEFHLRGYWNDNGIKEFSINASKNTPGGMAIYPSRTIGGIEDIREYIKEVVENNKPNDLENMVYAKGGSMAMGSGVDDVVMKRKVFNAFYDKSKEHWTELKLNKLLSNHIILKKNGGYDQITKKEDLYFQVIPRVQKTQDVTETKKVLQSLKFLGDITSYSMFDEKYSSGGSMATGGILKEWEVEYSYFKEEYPGSQGEHHDIVKVVANSSSEAKEKCRAEKEDYVESIGGYQFEIDSVEESNDTSKLKKRREFKEKRKKSSGGSMATGGRVYYIFEGFDHFNQKPLYQVSGRDNDYVGEWHKDRKDAEIELAGLNKKSSGGSMAAGGE